MYILIILIPLLSTLIVSIGGRKLGRMGVYRICRDSILIVTIIGIIGIYEVGIEKIGTIIELGEWIQTEELQVKYSFIFDSLTLGMIFTIGIISWNVFIFSRGYLEEDPNIIRYYINLSWFVLFMIILVSSDNYIITFVCWEGVGITSYLLINYWYTRRDSNLSAMQAVILNRIGDWGLLVGIFIIVIIYKNVDYITINILNNYIYTELYILGLLNFFILLAGIAKSAQFLLHTWLPSAMAAPTPISSLLHAATMVTLGVYIIIRSSGIISGISNILLVIYFIGAITSLMAALTGLSQFDIKKIIAFSTSSQIGYMITACGSQEYGIAMNHLINHAFFKAFLFINAGSIIHYIKDEQDVRNIGLLIKTNPWLHFSFLIGSLSLIAFPYFSGFYSKDLILEDLANTWSFTLSGRIVYFLQLITAFITSIYCFRSYFYLFINDNSNNNIIIKEHFLFPSFFLSIPTVFSGYFLSDLLVGPGSSFWDSSSLFYWSDNELPLDEFLWISLLIPFFGIIIGFILSIEFIHNNHNINTNRFYFDQIYNNVFSSSLLLHSKLSSSYLDKGLLEQLGFKSLHIFYSNFKFNSLDSGFLPNYLLFFFFPLFLFFFDSFLF